MAVHTLRKKMENEEEMLAALQLLQCILYTINIYLKGDITKDLAMDTIVQLTREELMPKH